MKDTQEKSVNKNIQVKAHLVERLHNKIKPQLGISDLDINEEVTSNIVRTSIDFTIEELKAIPYNIRFLLYEIENIDKKLNQHFFETIDYDFVGAIIRHLRDVCSQKREKHSMSANFIIFSEKCDIAQKARKSIRQESCELNRDSEITFNKEQRQELYKAYRLVNSTRSFFAFKKYMVADRVIYKYEGLFDFSKDKMLIDEQMLEICYDFETVGFSVEEGKNCIRVYHNATHLFDYYLNESSGDWKLRSRGEIERFVQEFLKGRMVEQFASTIIDLAYKGIGSMIIITDSIEKFEKDKKSSQIVNIKLTEELLKGQFFDFASDDGAVVINRESEKDLKLYSYGVFINPICDLDEEYNKYIQQTHSGTRHEKAARYACENPNDYVFIISDNKTISFLHGKEIIFWRDKLIKDGGKA